MRVISLLILVTLIFNSCNEEEVRKTKSGYFTLSQLKSPSNGRTSSQNEVTTDFDLGDLKASREFYFILGNSGENPITDITIETNDSRFIVSPHSISTLPGVNSNGTIIPLVSLSVVHGVQLNGVGFTDILEMGEHLIVLTIKGKTIENETPIDLVSEFTFKLNAKVMDIQLFDGNNEIDLTNPSVYVTGTNGAGGLGILPGYSVFSRVLTIKNAGNVDIRVLIKYDGSQTETIHDMILTVNQSSDFVLPEPQVLHLVSLDSQGTIANFNRIQLGNDGKGYFLTN